MKGYKTLAFNLVMAVVMVMAWVWPEGQAPSQELVAETVDTVWAAINAVAVFGNVLLRLVTTTPVFNRGDTEA